jgi:hypothetical protein
MKIKHSILLLAAVAASLIPLSGIRPAAPKAPAHKAPMAPVQMGYGHAVVDSGIHSVRELADVVSLEPNLYRGLNLSRAKMTTAKSSFLAYTSYRKNGHIYFTKNPVLILTGEALLTDGNILIRARCGNLLSVVPLTPVLTDEPPDTELLTPPSFEIPFPDQPIPTVPTGSPIPPPTPETPIAPSPIVPIIPTLCCATVPVTPLPSSTPEPETFVLFGTGLAAFFFRRKQR